MMLAFLWLRLWGFLCFVFWKIIFRIILLYFSIYKEIFASFDFGKENGILVLNEYAWAWVSYGDADVSVDISISF